MFSLKFEHYRWKGNEIQYVFIGISLILLVTLQTIGISLAVILYIFLSVLMNVLHINR
jgi:CDP-diacylglycerol--serine O-phosphatidyltransferase